MGLLVGPAIALTAGSASLLVVDGSAPTWQLLGIGVAFRVQNGLTVAPNQTAMYVQAPAGQTGVAAGLLRSSMYLGAVAPTCTPGHRPHRRCGRAGGGDRARQDAAK